MEEVCRYIKDFYGFVEVNQQEKEYQSEYMQLRASFIMQYAPELLGEYAKMPELDTQDEAEITRFVEENKLRQQAASQVATDVFDIDLHIYEKNSGDTQMRLLVESQYGYIGGNVSGFKTSQKQFHNILCGVYKYYGITKEDIEQKTNRYNDFIHRMLA